MALNYAGFRALGVVDPTTGAFTEITGAAGYARQPITLVVGDGGIVTNSADITYGPATGGAWPSYSGVGIYDALTGGNLIMWYDSNKPNVVPVGGTVTIAAKTMSLSFPPSAYTNHGTAIQLARNVDVSGKSIVVANV